MGWRPSCGGSSASLPWRPLTRSCGSRPDQRKSPTIGDLSSPANAKLVGLLVLEHRETRHLAAGAIARRAGNWFGPLRKRMGGPPARRGTAAAADGVGES